MSMIVMSPDYLQTVKILPLSCTYLMKHVETTSCFHFPHSHEECRFHNLTHMLRHWSNPATALQVGDLKIGDGWVTPRKGLEAGLHLASTMIHLSTPAIIAGSIDLHQTLDLEALVGNGCRVLLKVARTFNI